MKKKLNALAGFTLAELLIVVAIIAVLVAISIPIFSSKLEASREATDAANLRAAYAAGASALLLERDDANGKIEDGEYAYTKGGKILPWEDNKSQAMKGKASVDGYQGPSVDDLPDGVRFNHSSKTDTFDSDGEVANAGGGSICVVLKKNASSTEKDVQVFFADP